MRAPQNPFCLPTMGLQFHCESWKNTRDLTYLFPPSTLHPPHSHYVSGLTSSHSSPFPTIKSLLLQHCCPPCCFQNRPGMFLVVLYWLLPKSKILFSRVEYSRDFSHTWFKSLPWVSSGWSSQTLSGLHYNLRSPGTMESTQLSPTPLSHPQHIDYFARGGNYWFYCLFSPLAFQLHRSRCLLSVLFPAIFQGAGKY